MDNAINQCVTRTGTSHTYTRTMSDEGGGDDTTRGVAVLIEPSRV
jgi:hypothetical protein